LNGIVVLDVMLSSTGRSVDAFTFDLAFPEDRLDFVDCMPGDLDPGWIGFDCARVSDGVLRVAAYNAGDSRIPSGSHGSLVSLSFSSRNLRFSDSQILDFALSRCLDDLVGFENHQR